MTKSLTWPQVNAWRMRQHYLAHRLKHHSIVEATSRIGGVQAQVMSAAELSLWARTDGLRHEHIQTALWEDHTLLKTWAMRGTLHLIAANDLPLFAAARSELGWGSWEAYFEYYKVSKEQYEAYFAAAPEVLGTEPMTREQFAGAISQHINVPHLREVLAGSNWGSPLKPIAFRGDLCFGPSTGRNVTFVNPAQWIGKHQEYEPQEAFAEIARRYLTAYGPATAKDLALWWGGSLSKVKKILKSMGDELETVDVGGRESIALRSTIKDMQNTEPSNAVNLLPMFDTYVIGTGRDIEELLPMQFKARVFRPQGWITATVLVGGAIRGTWEYKTAKDQTTVTVKMFAPATPQIKKGIAVEAERLEPFLGTKVSVQYAD